MRRARVFGLSVLLASLVLVLLMLVEVPTVFTTEFPIASPVEIQSVLAAGPCNFHNLSLQIPRETSGYSVVGEVSPADLPIEVDLWVVNDSGLALLAEYLSYGDIFRPDYPDNRPFDTITTYAKEINITGHRQFELSNFDHNGTYCLLFLNFYESTQTATISVKEARVEPYNHSFLERTPLVIAVVGATVAVGAYFTFSRPRRSAKRAKSLVRSWVPYLVQ